MTHTHLNDDQLTFGCPGCLARIEDERWKSAPLREVTWGAILRDMNRFMAWEFTTTARIPAGVDPADLDDAAFDIGAELLGTFERDFELWPNWTLADVATFAKVNAIKIGAPIEQPATIEQPPLFGGDAA